MVLNEPGKAPGVKSACRLQEPKLILSVEGFGAGGVVCGIERSTTESQDILSDRTRNALLMPVNKIPK